MYLIMDNLPDEMILGIIDSMDSVSDIHNFCCSSEKIANICKENSNRISKRLVKAAKIDYKDPTNFVYVENEVDISDYKSGILKVYFHCI